MSCVTSVNKKINSELIINLGIPGFPFIKTAPINKCIYLNKILIRAGYKTIVINNEVMSSNLNHLIEYRRGNFESIEYYNTLKNPLRPKSPIMRRLKNYLGKLAEIKYLFSLNAKRKIKAAFLFPNGSVVQIFLYWFIAKILKFKLILIYHEFRSDFEGRKKSMVLKCNDKIFDYYSLRLADAILPISEFLILHSKKIAPQTPIFKLPPLTDFSLFKNIGSSSTTYFLYCGSAGYGEIIDFIIKSYDLIDIEHDYKLFMVIGGSKNQITYIKNLIYKSKNKNRIQIFNNLEFNDLITLYMQAKALLIPLKSDLRDQARFPQKIAEYTASGKVILTTNYGEIKFYFKDGNNALIANEFNFMLFSEKMKFVIENPEESNIIGMRGRLTGINFFNYISYTEKLKSFLEKL